MNANSIWGVLACSLVLGAWVGSAQGQTASLPVAPAETSPDGVSPIAGVLLRAAPAIVKVRRGRWWGTGVVFGSRRTIVTSYELVNGPGELQVVIADGVSRTARVVAWSPSDDLALLELDVDAAQMPLRAMREPLSVGMGVMMLYQPRDPELSAEVSGGWGSPLPRFTHLSRVAPRELDLDLSVWGLLGDDGGVVVSESGELIGVISRRSARQWRTIVTRIEAIEQVSRDRDRQGVFSPAGRGAWFNELFVTPYYSTVFESNRESRRYLGAGAESGYHYDWLFASLSLGLFQSNQRRLSADVGESLQRFDAQFQAGVEFKLMKAVDVFAGPGLSLTLDDIETSSVDATGALQATESHRGSAHPTIVVGATSGSFFARDVLTISNPPEARLDLGIIFGSRSLE